MSMGMAAVVALFCVCVCGVLKRYNGEYAWTVSLLAGALLFWQVIALWEESRGALAPLWETLRGTDTELSVLWKCALLCLLTRFVCDCCLDGGEKALASQVELFGKATVVLTAMPLFLKLANVIAELAGG